MRTVEEREREFLVGLAKLTRETRLVISGCGCCGSPSLDRATDAELDDPEAGYGYAGSGEVCWISHSDDHNWDKYSDSIVLSSTGS